MMVYMDLLYNKSLEYSNQNVSSGLNSGVGRKKEGGAVKRGRGGGKGGRDEGSLSSIIHRSTLGRG